MKHHFKKALKLEKVSSNWYEIWAIISLSIAGITEGSAFSWTSPAIPILTSEEFEGNITLEEASYLTMMPCFALFVFGPLFAYLMNKIGRKPSLMLICIPHLTHWIIIMATTNIYLLYLARFIQGCADGIYFTVLPNYMAEITSPNIRGTWGNLPTIAIYFGQLLINIAGGYLSIKITAYIFCVFPILFFISFWFLPESPYYLIMEERIDDARLSLKKLRRSNHVEDELNKLIIDVKRQTSETSQWKDLFVNVVHRKALICGMFVRLIQQFSGISAFSTYTVYLFQQAGLEMSNVVSAIIFMFLLVVMNSITSCTLDKLGRRLAMIISSGMCALILFSQFLFFMLKDELHLDTSSISWFPLLGLVLYVVFYSIGLGIVPTLIIGELFSASIKAKGVCGLNYAFGVYVLSSTKIFQVLTESYGLYAPFLLYFCFTAVGTVSSFFLVPETKGKTLEEIQESMKK